MPIRSIKNAKNLAGKRVFVRVDVNVPMKNGKVADDKKLLASSPTIEYLMKKKAKVILSSHLGRPGGKIIPSMKLDPVAKRLGKLMGMPIAMLKTKDWELSDREWENIHKKIHALKPGGVVMVDNIRFSPDEEGDKGHMAMKIASLADAFVLDGFGSVHPRPDASVSGAARYLPSYAGLLLEKEVNGLTKILKKSATPFVAIIGGAKMQNKIPVIQALLPKVSSLLVGGGIVNTYLKAAGYGVGESLVDEDLLGQALRYGKKRKIIWPVDVIVGKKNSLHGRQVMIGKKSHEICKKGEAIYDIGPETIRLFASYIKKAKTVIWNGAMGWFEQKPFDVGTLSIARLVAAQSKGKAFGVIGGGETVQAMELVGMTDDVDLVSTGGGAMLEFLAGEKLPGIEALKKNNA